MIHQLQSCCRTSTISLFLGTHVKKKQVVKVLHWTVYMRFSMYLRSHIKHDTHHTPFF